MTELRRSRRGWTAFARPPTAESRQRRIAVAVLYAAVILNMLLTVLVFSYVLALKQSRDAEQHRAATEQQRIEQEIRRNNCALFDGLPAGGPLTPLRATYHCGPGLAHP